jgi:hypothetical protein
VQSLKKLVFRGKEFEAYKITKNDKSIIFYDEKNVEIYRLQPLSQDLTEYVVYDENENVCSFDCNDFNTNIITTGTDVMRLIYAIMKENTELKERIETLEGGV